MNFILLDAVLELLNYFKMQLHSEELLLCYDPIRAKKHVDDVDHG